MPAVNIWKMYKEMLSVIFIHGLLQPLGFFLNIFCEMFVPNGLPKFVRRRLPVVLPELCGEAMLCSMCRKIFEGHKHESSTFSSWTAYRHQDDLSLLEISANSGCDICVRLYEWMRSIPKGPAWSDYYGSPVPWGFTIRSHLSKTVAENNFELNFTIFRWEGTNYSEDKFFHALRLKIIPAGDIRDMRNPLPIDKTTISHSSMTVVNFWIDYCNKNHPRCQNAGNMWQPTRLINVGTASAPVAHLIHTSTLPETVKYATLSHCWGDPKNAPVFRLLENNIEALQGALPIKELPCTFQETITLARILGISYLWIDSLCIIQESKSDWATESLTMGETYGNSHCNIAATGFPDSRRGIAVLRDPRNLQLREIQIKKPATEGQGVPPGSYFCVNEVWEDGIVTAPLNRRAWVFQERYLSPRILHFGACQLSWECMELEACEMFPLGLPNAFVTNYKKNSPFRVAYSTTSPLSHNDKSLLKSWCEAVSVYTRGDLTMEKDKLIAIAGIAEAMHRNLQCDYYSGLWQKGLPNHLLWLTRHLQAGKASRPESYIAPSWSWASLKGAVTFLDPGSGMTPYVTVLQCHVVSAVSQQFGQVSDGYLRLRGPLAQASFIESEEKLNSYTQNEPWHPVAFRTQGSEPRLTIKLTLHVDVYPQPKPGRFEMEFYANTNREAIGSRTFSY